MGTACIRNHSIFGQQGSPGRKWGVRELTAIIYSKYERTTGNKGAGHRNNNEDSWSLQKQ